MNNLIRKIIEARFVFVCGNGGSAATAEHFTNDLFSSGIKAICLNSNTSIITMIANDYGYPFVFSKQLKLYGSSKDLLITISCSGTSPNILTAISAAKTIGMEVYPFESFKNDERNYELLEDRHLKFAHKTALGVKKYERNRSNSN